MRTLILYRIRKSVFTAMNIKVNYNEYARINLPFKIASNKIGDLTNYVSGKFIFSDGKKASEVFKTDTVLNENTKLMYYQELVLTCRG